MRGGWLAGAALAGSAAGGTLVKKLWLAKYREQANVLAETSQERDLLYTWLLLRENNVGLAEYFTAHNLKTVAILGMNRIGRRFFDELQNHTGVKAAYGLEIDHLSAVHEALTVYRLGDDPLPPADCIVICDMDRVLEKAKAVRREFPGEVISLPNVMAWLLERHRIEPRDGAIAGWPSTEV